MCIITKRCDAMRCDAHHRGKSPAEDSNSTPKNLSKDPKMALCTMIGLVFSAFSPSATTAPEHSPM